MANPAQPLAQPQVPANIDIAVVPNNQVPPRVVQHVLVNPVAPPCIGLRGSDGRMTVFRTTAAQDGRLTQLHTALTQGYLAAHPAANLFINLQAGQLEENGRMVARLDTPALSNDLRLMRELFDEVLGRPIGSGSWYSFRPYDRARSNVDPAMRNQIRLPIDRQKVLEKIPAGNVVQRRDAGKKYDFSITLMGHLRGRLDRRKADVLNLRTLDAQSRAQEIEAGKGFDELPILFAALHTYDLVDPTNTANDPGNIRLLNEAKDHAVEFIKANKHTFARWKNPSDELINSLATELALLSCKTREEYDFGLAHFKLSPTQTSTELFILRLAAIPAANVPPQSRADHVNNCFDLAFPEISNADDRNYLKAELLNLITQPRTQALGV